MQAFLVDLGPILVVGISLGSLYGLVGLAFTVIINAMQRSIFASENWLISVFGVRWLPRRLNANKKVV